MSSRDATHEKATEEGEGTKQKAEPPRKACVGAPSAPAQVQLAAPGPDSAHRARTRTQEGPHEPPTFTVRREKDTNTVCCMLPGSLVREHMIKPYTRCASKGLSLSG
eukprot:7377506-Prymnesium_polylepis.1